MKILKSLIKNLILRTLLKINLKKRLFHNFKMNFANFAQNRMEIFKGNMPQAFLSPIIGLRPTRSAFSILNSMTSFIQRIWWWKNGRIVQMVIKFWLKFSNRFYVSSNFFGISIQFFSIFQTADKKITMWKSTGNFCKISGFSNVYWRRKIWIEFSSKRFNFN